MIRTKAISFNDNNNNNNNNNNNGDIFTSCDLTMSGFKYSPVEKMTTTKIHLIIKKNYGNNNTNSNDKNMKK